MVSLMVTWMLIGLCACSSEIQLTGQYCFPGVAGSPSMILGCREGLPSCPGKRTNDALDVFVLELDLHRQMNEKYDYGDSVARLRMKGVRVVAWSVPCDFSVA